MTLRENSIAEFQRSEQIPVARRVRKVEITFETVEAQFLERALRVDAATNALDQAVADLEVNLKDDFVKIRRGGERLGRSRGRRRRGGGLRLLRYGRRDRGGVKLLFRVGFSRLR